MNIELLIKEIKQKAEQEAKFDNEGFNAYDWSGGNFDDAYSIGIEDGEVSICRRLLKYIKEDK